MALPDDYESTCRQWTSALGEFQFQRWVELGEVLGRRPGWWFNADWQAMVPATIAWCFGLDGAARLVVSLDGADISLFDHEADRSRAHHSVEDLIGWLELHESEYAGFTPLQDQLLGDLLPGQIEQWKTGDEGPA